MGERVFYAGYGANFSGEMMEWITGARLITGRSGFIKGYRLAIQTLQDVPSGVREILERVWPRNFQSYTIAPGNDTDKVRCIVWDLTDLQRKLVRNWEIIGEDQDPIENRWYKENKVTVVLLNGNEIEVLTEGLREGQSFDRIVYGERYMTFLNDPAMFKKIATEAREDYLRELAKSQGLPTST